MQKPKLPVEEIFPALDTALDKHNAAVLVAPPGAGKTTLIPLHLLKAAWRNDGIIVVLEPRRLAARAAALRMADLLGEKIGQTVGYRMRLDTQVSDKTRIMVVTEGVFARMILDDPELTNIAAILFDEFHERSLDADFGLALTLDVQQGLRPDLRILVMSATLDGARVASLLENAPLIESQGRSFPVEILYQPKKNNERLEDAVLRTIKKSLLEHEGSLLVFLPGQKEIERIKALLKNLESASLIVAPLYGALDKKEQDKAILPTQAGTRKIVLTSAIAESSLTIDGVRIVIDSGFSRVPFYEAATGLTRLETIRASRASVDQRAGRAGRTSAGIAIRLWSEGQMAALAPFSSAEILAADLSSLVIDSASFGIKDLSQLKFLDAPPKPAIIEAKNLLKSLNAIDKDGHITPLGQQMRHYHLPIRLAAMMIKAKQRNEVYLAAELAVILSERGLGGNQIDLDRRLELFRLERSERAQKARILVKRLAGKNASSSIKDQPFAVGRLLLDAWPDRVAKSRSINSGRFVLANGRGVMVDELSQLAKAPFLVVADLMGQAEQARILSAAEIDEDTIRNILKDKIETRTTLSLAPQGRNLQAREKLTLGAIVLSDHGVPMLKGDKAKQAIIYIIKAEGLSIINWSKEANHLRQRLRYLHDGLGEQWPNMSDENLLEKLHDWLLPFLNDDPYLDAITNNILCNGLISLVPYNLQRDIDKKAPKHFIAPLGTQIAIQYDGEAPMISVRVQELYGLNQHPSIVEGKIPLIIELLSPARRPIQITRDLVSFWAGSWAEVRSEMRGRYPKHLWPENPLLAAPTQRAKPRS